MDAVNIFLSHGDKTIPHVNKSPTYQTLAKSDTLHPLLRRWPLLQSSPSDLGIANRVTLTLGNDSSVTQHEVGECGQQTPVACCQNLALALPLNSTAIRLT